MSVVTVLMGKSQRLIAAIMLLPQLKRMLCGSRREARHLYTNAIGVESVVAVVMTLLCVMPLPLLAKLTALLPLPRLLLLLPLLLLTMTPPWLLQLLSLLQTVVQMVVIADTLVLRPMAEMTLRTCLQVMLMYVWLLLLLTGVWVI